MNSFSNFPHPSKGLEPVKEMLLQERVHLAVVATLGAALLLLTLPVARAQIRQGRPFPTPTGDEEKSGFTDAVTVPVNRQSKQLIQAAQDYIAKANICLR